MNLFDMIKEATALQDLIDSHAETHDGDITDIESIIDSWAQEYNVEKKLESIAYVLRELDAQSEALAKEEKKMKAKRQSLDSKHERLKNWAKFCLDSTGTKKIKAGIFDFSIRNSPESVELLTENIPDEFMRIKKEPDKALILQQLKSGVELEFASLVKKTNLQIK